MAKPRLLNMCGKIVPYEDARVHVLSTATVSYTHLTLPTTERV